MLQQQWKTIAAKIWGHKHKRGMILALKKLTHREMGWETTQITSEEGTERPLALAPRSISQHHLPPTVNSS